MSILSNNGLIEFVIPEESSPCIDLSNALLHVHARIKKQDSTVLIADSNVAPVCNFLHALWSQCDLFLNGVLLSQSSNTYPFRSYIETLLSFGEEAKKSQLSSLLQYQDTASRFDSLTNANKGFQKRKELAAGSRARHDWETPPRFMFPEPLSTKWGGGEAMIKQIRRCFLFGGNRGLDD